MVVEQTHVVVFAQQIVRTINPEEQPKCIENKSAFDVFLFLSLSFNRVNMKFVYSLLITVR